MKTFKYLFTVLAVIAILCSCSETNSPTTSGDPGKDDPGKDDPPAKVTTAKITFNNQSEDTYIVNVTSNNFSDQFEIKGNKNTTKTYTLSSVMGYYYRIKLTQKDGYVLYPTEHNFQIPLEEEGEVICWNNDKYWLN